MSVRQQTGNRNEWPLSGRLTLPGNGEDGRGAAVRLLRPERQESTRSGHWTGLLVKYLENGMSDGDDRAVEDGR